MTIAVVDTNLLVAIIDSRDKWHNRARELASTLAAQQVELVYLDCVLNETISVLARRAEEQKRADDFVNLLERTRQQVRKRTLPGVHTKLAACI